MGNSPALCGGSPQQCVDECARLHLETRSRDPEDPDCDPAGAVFNETLQGLVALDRELLRFSGTPNLAAVRWLLSMGASSKAKDRNGTTPLHAACRSGSYLIVNELVKQGALLDAQDNSNWSPLHIVAMLGRRELALLLIQMRAQVQLKNKRGLTPLLLCSDPGTKEVLEEFSTEHRLVMRGTIPDMVLGGTIGNGFDDIVSATCEPFFVPRLPLCRSDGNGLELRHLGKDLFGQSAGHSLAFLVASGAIVDHPTDLSQFLLKQHVDPRQLGEFLGEDFSLAQTLRLAYIHAVDVSNTGVVGALLKVFSRMRVPEDLCKVDRLIGGVAHLWWRQHEGATGAGGGGRSWEESAFQDNDDCNEWSLDFTVPQTPGTNSRPVEPTGQSLRGMLRSVEGLRRLMFSTVMLAWNMHNVTRLFSGGESPRRMALAAWLDTNLGLEADGGNLPVQLQKSIYEVVASDPERMEVLLPVGAELEGESNRCSKDVIWADEDAEESAADSSPEATALRMKDAMTLVRGWGSIPKGGLQRHEPLCTASAPSLRSRAFAAAGGARGADGANFRLAHCVLSESGSASAQGNVYVAGGQVPTCYQAPPDEGEVVWLTLRFSLFLFLSTSPTDQAPYAFLRLQDAVLEDVDFSRSLLVLAGKPPKPSLNVLVAGRRRSVRADENSNVCNSNSNGNNSNTDCSKPGKLKGGKSTTIPLGEDIQTASADANDMANSGNSNVGGGGAGEASEESAVGSTPLPLCFLLADGRFQPFEAQRLEIQLATSAELEQWSRAFAIACADRPTQKNNLLGGITGSYGPSLASRRPPQPGATGGVEGVPSADGELVLGVEEEQQLIFFDEGTDRALPELSARSSSTSATAIGLPPRTRGGGASAYLTAGAAPPPPPPAG